MDELTPEVVSTPSGTTVVQTNELTMGARSGGREVSGSTSVRTQQMFAELLA